VALAPREKEKSFLGFSHISIHLSIKFRLKPKEELYFIPGLKRRGNGYLLGQIDRSNINNGDTELKQ